MKSFFVVALFYCSTIYAELTHFERGVALYDQRANESNGLTANKEYIEQAIDQFLKAMKIPGEEVEVGGYLLKSYYDREEHVAVNDD